MGVIVVARKPASYHACECGKYQYVLQWKDLSATEAQSMPQYDIVKPSNRIYLHNP